MTSPLPDRFSPRETLRHFLLTLPDSIGTLERAVMELLESSWDESLRHRAHEISEALAKASAASGLSDLATVVRAITSLLKLHLEDTLVLQDGIRENLRELLCVLEEFRLKCKSSAKA